MTRRHFQAVADAILELKDKMPEQYREQFINKMVKMFQNDNPRFDETRFRAACAE